MGRLRQGSWGLTRAKQHWDQHLGLNIRALRYSWDFLPTGVSGPEGRGEKSLVSLNRKWEMLGGSVDTGQRGSAAHVPLSRWVSESGWDMDTGLRNWS